MGEAVAVPLADAARRVADEVRVVVGVVVPVTLALAPRVSVRVTGGVPLPLGVPESEAVLLPLDVAVSLAVAPRVRVADCVGVDDPVCEPVSKGVCVLLGDREVVAVTEGTAPLDRDEEADAVMLAVDDRVPVVLPVPLAVQLADGVSLGTARSLRELVGVVEAVWLLLLVPVPDGVALPLKLPLGVIEGGAPNGRLLVGVLLSEALGVLVLLLVGVPVPDRVRVEVSDGGAPLLSVAVPEGVPVVLAVLLCVLEPLHVRL